MGYLLKVGAISFHILDPMTLLENGIRRDGRKAFNYRFFTQTCVVYVSLHPYLFHIISLTPDEVVTFVFVARARHRIRGRADADGRGLAVRRPAPCARVATGDC